MRAEVILLAVAVASALACGPAAAPAGSPPAGSPPAVGPPAAVSAHSPEVQRLLAAAQAAGETELNLWWSQNTLGGEEGSRKYAAAFERLYGVPVPITYTPGPSMGDVAARLGQEIAAGRKPSTDVYVGAEQQLASMLTYDALEAYDYTQLSPRITPDVVASGNVGVQIASRVPGISYNPTLVPAGELPRRLEDVLNPKWKGTIASTPDAVSFDAVAYRPEWTPDRMRQFVGRVSENVGGLIRCGELGRVMSGEFRMLVLDCGGFTVRRQKQKDAPLAHVIPEDAPTAVFWHMGVPRNAAHPNLAKLWINMMLSEEGQRTIYETDATDHYALPGSQSAAELSELRAKGIEPLRLSVQFVVEHPEMRQLSDDLVKILREQPGR